jgi:hypothetical protein
MLLAEGLTNYDVKMDLVVMVYIPSFIKIRLDIQKLIGWKYT